MKNIILLAALFFALDSFGATDYVECEGSLENMDMGKVYGDEHVNVLYDITANLNKRAFKSMPVLKELDYNSCQGAITEISYIDMDGNEFMILHSSQDECDGGNSYGVVYNKDSYGIVAHVKDGDFYCTKK